MLPDPLHRASAIEERLSECALDKLRRRRWRWKPRDGGSGCGTSARRSLARTLKRMGGSSGRAPVGRLTAPDGPETVRPRTARRTHEDESDDLLEAESDGAARNRQSTAGGAETSACAAAPAGIKEEAVSLDDGRNPMIDEKPLRGNLWNDDGEGTPGSRVPRSSSAFDVSCGRGARRQFSFAGLSPDDHRSPRQRGTGFRPIRRDADPVGHEGQETVRRGRMVLRGTSAVSRLRSGVEDGRRASLEGSPRGFLGATP